jgi:hypothetical protein
MCFTQHNTCTGDWLTLVPPVQLTGLLLRHQLIAVQKIICFTHHNTCAGDWLTLVPPVQLTGLLLRHHQLLFEPQASGT